MVDTKRPNPLKSRRGQLKLADVTQEVLDYINSVAQDISNKTFNTFLSNGDIVQPVFDIKTRTVEINCIQTTQYTQGLSLSTISSGGTIDDGADVFGTANLLNTPFGIDAGIRLVTNYDFTKSGYNSKFFFMFKPSTLTLTRTWMGLFSGDPENNDTPFVSMIGLRLSMHDKAQSIQFRIQTSVDGLYGVSLDGLPYVFNASGNTATEIRDAIVDAINELQTNLLAEAIDDTDDDKYTVTATIPGNPFEWELLGLAMDYLVLQDNVVTDHTFKIVTDNGSGDPNVVDTGITPESIPYGFLLETLESGTLVRWSILDKTYSILASGLIDTLLPDVDVALQLSVSVEVLEELDTKSLVLYYVKGIIGDSVTSLFPS